MTSTTLTGRESRWRTTVLRHPLLWFLGPLAAAFTVTAVTEGRAGLRRWRRRLFQVRAGLGGYLAHQSVPLIIGRPGYAGVRA